MQNPDPRMICLLVATSNRVTCKPHPQTWRRARVNQNLLKTTSGLVVRLCDSVWGMEALEAVLRAKTLKQIEQLERRVNR